MPCPLRSHIAHPLHQRMILRIRRLLIQHLHRFPIQTHEFTLEANPVDLRDIGAIVILEEQAQTVGVAERRPFDRHILDLGGLR